LRSWLELTEGGLLWDLPQLQPGPPQPTTFHGPQPRAPPSFNTEVDGGWSSVEIYERSCQKFVSCNWSWLELTEGGLLMRSWLKLIEGGELRIFGLGLTKVGWLWRPLLKLRDG
jgi:hypothetical protein